MNTLIFDNLSRTGCQYFLAYVQRQEIELIKYPTPFNTEQSMVDLINLYTNYKYTGLWYAQRKYAKSKIIALATALKKERANNSACKKPPGTTNSNPNGLSKWRFEHTLNNKTDFEGNQFVWYKNNGRKY